MAAEATTSLPSNPGDQNADEAAAGDATTATAPDGIHKLFENGNRPNLLFIITDQERSLQHWPQEFVPEHLPAMHKLQQNGITFQQAFCTACMCSPSRASLLTSQYPVVTGVTSTGSPQPKFALPTDIPNLATYLSKNYGYHCEWHGKWHLGNTPEDYGFHGWQPPDAGNYLSLNDTLGGGTPDNDNRFLKELQDFFISRSNDNNNKQPFCLVASFVNPHDVYVAQYDPTLGYTRDDFHRIEMPLPSNYIENLMENYKPRCQGDMGWPFVTFDNTPEEYVNFYAYLHTIVDRQIGQLLETLKDSGLEDSTLIVRTADHGEQGLSHTLVEKFYNAYEESIRVPLVVSNPVAFTQSYKTDALASHVDIMPTLLELLEQSSVAAVDSGASGSAVNTGATDDNNNDGDGSEQQPPDSAIEAPSVTPITLKDTDCVGTSLVSILNHPHVASTEKLSSSSAKKTLGLQQSIHFTYDDIPNYRAPSIVRCLRTMRYKYAVYYTPTGRDADWEMYDLQKDPLENDNLAGRPEFETLQNMLDRQLVHQMTHKQTLPTKFDWPPKSTSRSVGKIGGGGSPAFQALVAKSDQASPKGPNGYPELPIEEIMEYKRRMAEDRAIRAALSKQQRRRRGSGDSDGGNSSSSSSSGGPISREDAPHDHM